MRIRIISGKYQGMTATVEHNFGKSAYAVTLDDTYNSALVNRSDAIPLANSITRDELADGTIESREYDELGRLCVFTRE